MKTIAFYLPQFHPIPENDKWWGKGFTEWTNVTKAYPQFSGHYQPRLPADLGFYDLRLEEIRLEQVRLATQHGLYGFCYHYYWFNGKKLLDLPLRRLIENKEINFPFCLCYANENWTRRWDGQEEDILMKQEHSPETNINFIRDLIPFFKDSRYIKINNKPLLLVYRTAIIPDIANVVEIWRSEAKKAGFEDIYLCKCLTFGDFHDPAEIGFDATVEFPPHGLNIGEKSEYLQLAKTHNPYFNGKIFDYAEAANQMMSRDWPSYNLFKTVMLGWDNTARRGNNAHIFHNFNIETYEDWLQKILKRTIERYPEDERIVFINAWNEWAEGTYLEPDQKHGHECLKATKRAILSAEAWEELVSSCTKANFSRDIALGLLNYLENKERKEVLIVKTLENLEALIYDKDTHIKNLETIIYDKDVHTRDLETIIKDKDMLIDAIRNTRGWRALERIRRIRNRLFHLFNYLRGHKVNTFLKKRNKYEEWIRRSEPSPAELDLQKKTTFNCYPKISIVVPTYNTPEQFLKEMVESVINQTYSNWELCIADGESNKPYIREILNSCAKRDERIKIKFLDENKGIAGNSNEALDIATGDFITLLDHDDMLSPFALFEVVKTINENPDADFIYSDEDKISEDGKKQFDPHFKPDWSPDTLRSYNYICHLTVIKKALLYKVGFFRGDYEGSQDYDLIFRATEDANKILHIPKILYHWRAHLSSAAGDVSNKMYAIESGKKAVADHLKRIGLTGTAEGGWPYKVVYNFKDSPLISIIIPNKDHTKDLGKCVESIISKSSYNNFEIIIIENRSVEKDTFELYIKLEQLKNVRIIKWDHLFNFGSLNNFAVNYAEGEVLLFLNNDTEVITYDWLECMLGHVLRKEIGAVGAKLYYPDNTIQHAGVILGIKGVAGHSHKYFPRDSKGYFCRANIIQNLSAVTAACMMMRREVFEEVGRFDERYSHAFNDVDLCMKIRQKGYLIVFTPYAELYHHESKSRGHEDTREKQERFKKEIEYFQKKWKNELAKGDPYYNPNLTLDREDFSIKI